MSEKINVPIYISTKLDKESVEKVKSYLNFVFKELGENAYTYTLRSSGAGLKRVPLPRGLGGPEYINVAGRENAESLKTMFTERSAKAFNEQLSAANARVNRINEAIEGTTHNLSKWKNEIAVANKYGTSAIGSFWSVWSVSWAIRGTLQDILGYSNKWVGEVNKLTRAFQSGLYLYAGTERILKSVGEQVLRNNKFYKEGLLERAEAAKIQRKILVEKAAMATLDKKINKQDIEAHKQKISLLEAERKEHLAIAAGKIAEAEEKTVDTRAALVGPAMGAVAAVSGVMVGVGILQWIKQYNESFNKALRTTKELAKQVASLGDATSTVKLDFSDLNGLINKLTTQYEEFGRVIENVNDPFERFAKTFSFLVEKQAQKEKRTNFFEWLTDAFHRMNKSIGKSYETGYEEMFGKPPPEKDIEKLERYKALMSDLKGGGPINERQGFLDQLFKLASSSVSNNIKSVDQLREAYQKYKKVIVATMVAETLETYIGGLRAQERQLQTQHSVAAMEKLAKVEAALADPTGTLTKYWEDYFDNLEGKAEKGLTASKNTVMALQDFYKQMYEAYNDAAKHDSRYQKQADYWKKKYIGQLKTIISQDTKEIQTLKAGTEEWKKKNLELAKARQALADMLDLSEKLKSTWWNIPNAVIHPTQAQLTSTILLQPQFVINANTVDEIKEAVGKQLENYTWKMNEPTGTEGGAL